ncbi:hypothetical protein PoB_002472200 [Plakobranchus ocellatus]|uniref:Uncharacterized protein n=1 Tax=Plakobranchus ocellatus TaxID=259542 RepID=A0AAV3ZU60_9GAST|nr:hypothetical protein PoB_002472200 [Plakobranchus ocellatus]
MSTTAAEGTVLWDAFSQRPNTEQCSLNLGTSIHSLGYSMFLQLYIQAGTAYRSKKEEEEEQNRRVRRKRMRRKRKRRRRRRGGGGQGRGDGGGEGRGRGGGVEHEF